MNKATCPPVRSFTTRRPGRPWSCTRTWYPASTRSTSIRAFVACWASNSPPAIWRRFSFLDDLTDVVEARFTDSRSDRAHGTVSYDVELTNVSDRAVTLPLLLTLDPATGYAGVPRSGSYEEGRWIIDLSEAIPAGGTLAPGQTTIGRTVAIDTPVNQRVRFTSGLVAGLPTNHAPWFQTTPPATAQINELYVYAANANDQNGDGLVYRLLQGPEGMTVDPLVGTLAWTPGSGSAATVPVVMQAIDSRGRYPAFIPHSSFGRQSGPDAGAVAKADRGDGGPSHSICLAGRGSRG